MQDIIQTILLSLHQSSGLVLRLVIAAALGSLIGIERERLAWAAGLRTHLLVSVGACLIMIVSTLRKVIST